MNVILTVDLAMGATNLVQAYMLTVVWSVR